MESTLIDMVGDKAVSVHAVRQFLRALVVPINGSTSEPAAPNATLARDCWEHLLEDLSPHFLDDTMSKMSLLHEHGLSCPAQVFRTYWKLEAVVLAVDAIGCQKRTGQLWMRLRKCVAQKNPKSSPQRQAAASIRARYKDQRFVRALVNADLLLVAHVLVSQGAAPIMNREQQRTLLLAHFARHGPLWQLGEVLREFSEPGSASSQGAVDL